MLYITIDLSLHLLSLAFSFKYRKETGFKSLAWHVIPWNRDVSGTENGPTPAMISATTTFGKSAMAAL